jgi:hypothetical protein
MFDITGRILTINEISKKSAQIVIKKTIKGKLSPIAIDVFGLWKEKADKMKLKKNDKIGGRLYIKSRLWKNKWYNDLFFNEIFLIEDKKKQDNNNKEDLFTSLEGGIGNKFIIDEETGEILL